MKIIFDISLKDFGFWSGAKDTAEQLTDEQFDQVEAMLEDLYPDGMTATGLNDIFWFESNKIYEWAGCFPKFFKLTATCGRVKYVRAEDSDDVDEVEGSYCDSEEVEEDECDDIEDVSDVELNDFSDTHYFSIKSRFTKHELIIHCLGDEAADDLEEAFFMCEIEGIAEVPAEGIDAIPRICQLILDPNNSLDYYEIPESHAINEYNRNLELNDKDIKNIDEFVANLHDVMPDGFTIDWDVESVGSPYFDPHPAFGLAMDCVKLRVYPNEADTRGNN